MNYPTTTSSLIDLSTFNEKSRDLFHHENDFHEWFSTVIIELQPIDAKSVRVSRSGDILSAVWVDVTFKDPSNKDVKWVKNLGHSIFEHISFMVDDIVIQRFENHLLDFMSTKESLKMIDGVSNSDGERVVSFHIPLFNNKPQPVLLCPYMNIKLSYEIREPLSLLRLNDTIPTLEQVGLLPIFKVNFYGLYYVTNGAQRLNLSHCCDMIYSYIDTYSYMKVCLEKTGKTACRLNEFNAVNKIYFAVVNESNPFVYKDSIVSSSLSYGNTPRYILKSHHTSFMMPYLNNITNNDSSDAYKYDNRYRDSRRGMISRETKTTLTEDNVHMISYMHECTTNYIEIKEDVILSVETNNYKPGDMLLIIIVSKDKLSYTKGYMSLIEQSDKPN